MLIFVLFFIFVFALGVFLIWLSVKHFLPEINAFIEKYNERKDEKK